MPQPQVSQLPLNDEQRERLQALVYNDYSRDSYDLERRHSAFVRWYRLWRNAMTLEGFPDQERSAFSVPLILWQILAKLSKELDALLGEESEVVVKPIGDLDIKRVKKVKKWMNWRVKNSLRLFKKLYIYLLQKQVFGTTIGYTPWITKKRRVKEYITVPDMALQPSTDPTTGLATLQQVQVGQHQELIEKEIVDFDGPDLVVENLEDWIVPQQARSIEQADHFIRRLRLSLDEVLDLRDEGKLDAALMTPDIIEQLKNFAETSKTVTSEALPNTAVTKEKLAQTGLPTVPIGREEKLVILNWFGKFRLNKEDERGEDVVAFYSVHLKKLLGACRLVDIFPDGRRPFIHSQAVMDVNSFWGIGVTEMLEPINREMDAFHNLATSAGEGAIGPVVFYNPASGFNPDKHRMEPYTAIPTADPNSVKVVNLGQINLSPYVLLMQQLMGFSERITALTDAQMGRQFDRPNAPRTYGQQALLQAESNVRLLLDIRLERENLGELLNRIWDMDKRWLPKPYFFRVTEEDAGDVLTDEDMMGEYDFDIGPVTSVSNRQARIQETLQALTLSQPMPQAYAPLLRRLLEMLGYPDVAAVIPDPTINPMQTPEQENARMWQGEDVDPHPQDNHMDHIAKHQDFLARMSQPMMAGVMDTTWEQSNPGLAGRVQSHIAEHQAAMKQGALAAMAMSMGKPGPGAQAGGPPGGQAMPGLQGALSQLMPQQPQNPAQPAMAGMLNTGNLNLG